jgi:YgiT-type zinc finger domain-containing protein
MKCVICKSGVTTDGTTTITLERGATTVVIKDVPARVCQNCGEAYLDDHVAAILLTVAEAAVKAGVQVDVRKYVA